MEELSAPNEKLLRSPYFWEKYGKATKWLSISFILLIILLTASGVLLRSQKSTTVKTPTPSLISTIPTITSKLDPTANWQIYRNEKYGYEIKYPNSLLIDEVTSSDDTFLWTKEMYFKYKGKNNSYYSYLWITQDWMSAPLEGHIGGKTVLKGNVKFIKSVMDGGSTENGGSGFTSFYIAKGDNVIAVNTFYASTLTDPIFDQILSTFKFTEKDENVISDLKKLIAEYKIDSKTGARVEIVSPDIMERNKKNEVKITINDWDKYGLNLYQSFLSIINIVDYRLGDKVYSSCKESNGQEECLVPVTPTCKWPEYVNLAPLVRIKTYNPPNEPDDHVLDFSNISVKISTSTTEICNNGIDDDCNGKIDGLDSKCSSFTITVLPGEGITNLARRSISQYLEKYYNEAYLNKEQKVYAEDYIKRDLKKKISLLKAGEKIEFLTGLIEEAIAESKKLSFTQINYLNKYTGKINYSAYRFISKTSSVKDADSVWKIDDNTKSKLVELNRYKDDGSESWKITEGNGSVIIYYENKDISKISYIIGAYRENITAQDYDFIESLLTHSVGLSEDGINWYQAKVSYNNFYDKGNSSSTGDGTGTGSFYLDVKNYNNGRIFVKFNLTSNTSGTGITLTKNLKTNLDN